MSAGHPWVGCRYPLKITHRLSTRGSGSYIPTGHWQIQVTILDFHRYPQVPAGYLLPAHSTQYIITIDITLFIYILNLTYFLQKPEE